jgi:hypothetical protein
MPAQLHQTHASDEAMEFVARNALMALPLAAIAATYLYRGFELRSLGVQILVIGIGGLVAAVAVALALTRQRLTLALGARTYARWRRFGRQAETEQGSLDELTGVTIDVRADYDTEGGATPIPYWVVLLEFKDPAKTVQVGRYAASAAAPKAYGYAIELARRLRTSFIDKAGFQPRVTPWSDLDKPMARDGRNRPVPALPTGSGIALSGQAPERRIGFPVAGRRWLAIIPASFCALIMAFGLAGFLGIIGPQRQQLDILGHEVQVWWVAPLAFFALGLAGLLATVIAVASAFEIRETAASLAFTRRRFGRPWRVTEVPKAAVIVIEHRLDPFRIRAGRHEVLIRAPGQVVRLREGGPSNADLLWLEQALRAML